MNIQDLKPAPYNPRMMKEKAKKGLRGSLKKFGDISGIVFNRQTGNLVAGHNRLEQLQTEFGDKLRMEPIEGSDDYFIHAGGNRFAVRVVDWDKTMEMAANISANNGQIQGRFTDALQPLLWKIKESLQSEFDALKLGELVKHSKTRGIEGEEEFSEVLNECNQYVVLVFRNSVDWLNALTHFGLESKTSQRANGKEWSKGIGRVLDGAKYLKAITAKALGA